MIVIDTQDYENYAAHTGFDGSFYWKAKGGSSYKVINVPADAAIDDVVEHVRGQIEQDTPYYQTSIIGYSKENDDWLSSFEQSQLEFDGEIVYKEPVIDYMEFMSKEIK